MGGAWGVELGWGMDFVLVDESVPPGDAGTYAQYGSRGVWAVGMKGWREPEGWVRSAVGVWVGVVMEVRFGGGNGVR